MSHGPPTKQPWSHPTLYPTEETTVGLMENPKMGRGGRTDVTKGKGGKRKKTARSVDSYRGCWQAMAVFFLTKFSSPKTLVKSLFVENE